MSSVPYVCRKFKNKEDASSYALQVFISLFLIYKVAWCMDIKKVQMDV